VKKAKAVNIPTIWWDNNNPTAGSGDAMGLLKRTDNTWYFPTIVTAIMNGNK
jgi:aryl-phospho-beta-D-glucosidase BglC (GH1 family)